MAKVIFAITRGHGVPLICQTLGPPVLPFYPFWGEGSPTEIDYSNKGTLILASLLED